MQVCVLKEKVNSVRECSMTREKKSNSNKKEIKWQNLEVSKSLKRDMKSKASKRACQTHLQKVDFKNRLISAYFRKKKSLN